MSQAIAVLNAGSSSLKFSLFEQVGDELELTLRGQAEGLQTAPRFVAKSASGETLSTHAWDDGKRLGHADALDHIVATLRGRLRAGTGARRRVAGWRVRTWPAWGTAWCTAACSIRSRCASTPRCWTTWRSSSRWRHCTSRTT